MLPSAGSPIQPWPDSDSSLILMSLWKRSDCAGRLTDSVVLAPLVFTVSGRLSVPRLFSERMSSRSRVSPSGVRRVPSRRRATFGAASPVSERTRIAGFCWRVEMLARTAAQRSSPGRQFDSWRSDASQISARPVAEER